jgi:hypothetical protein
VPERGRNLKICYAKVKRYEGTGDGYDRASGEYWGEWNGRTIDAESSGEQTLKCNRKLVAASGVGNMVVACLLLCVVLLLASAATRSEDQS